MFIVYVYCNAPIGEPFKKFCSGEAGKLLSIVEEYISKGYIVQFEYAEVV